jgi:hypothetical protein
MTFYEVLEQVLALLQQHGRVSYRALKRQFALDDDYIEDLKAELIQARRLAVDEQGAVLVWSGGAVGSSGLPAPAPRPHRRSSRKDASSTAMSPPRLRTLQRRNVASSRCCFVTWWTRPGSPVSSTRKSCARWYGPIKTPAPR